MTTLRDIDDFMSSYAPKTLSESWDNDGVMLCRSLDEKVDKIIVSLEVNSSVIDFAIKCNAKCIITHHPYIFKPLKCIRENTYSDIEKFVSNGISILSYHTRLDSTSYGVNDALADKLMLSDVVSFPSNIENGMGRVGSLSKEMEVAEFAEFVKECLHCDGIRIAFPTEKKVKRVAVLGGAGKDFLKSAVECNADAFVSADLSHNTFIDGVEMGIVVVDAGHYYTENPITEHIANELKSRLKTEVQIFDVKAPYMSI